MGPWAYYSLRVFGVKGSGLEGLVFGAAGCRVQGLVEDVVWPTDSKARLINEYDLNLYEGTV